MNKWRTHGIRIQGIRIQIHPLFFFILLGAIWTGLFLEIATLFVIVIIHELGHLFTARSYGWRIEEIQLLPFGGVIEVAEHGNVSALEEMIVALAGPLNNGLMIWIAYFFSDWGWWSPEWTAYFIQANAVIALFNLLPILPLDGGKVLQAGMSFFIRYIQAVRLASGISFVLAILLLFYGLGFPNWGKIDLNVVIIALFLFFSNWQLLRNSPYQYMRFLMQRKIDYEADGPIGQRVFPLIVPSSYTVDETCRLFLRGKYHLIYIVEYNSDRNIIGMIPEERVLRVFFEEKTPQCAVAELLR